MQTQAAQTTHVVLSPILALRGQLVFASPNPLLSRLSLLAIPEPLARHAPDVQVGQRRRPLLEVRVHAARTSLAPLSEVEPKLRTGAALPLHRRCCCRRHLMLPVTFGTACHHGFGATGHQPLVALPHVQPHKVPLIAVTAPHAQQLQERRPCGAAAPATNPAGPTNPGRRRRRRRKNGHGRRRMASTSCRQWR
jgi:hypothetical protein